MSDRDVARYVAATHAMQTGVAIEHERGSKDGTPKHLRVGVNSTKVDHSALVKLLIERGLFTEDEYVAALADAMEAEKARYEEHLRSVYGLDIHLQ